MSQNSEMQASEPAATKKTKAKKPASTKAAPTMVEKLERDARKARRAKNSVPVNDSPAIELVRLVRQHAAIVKSAVSVHNQRSDRKNRETGEIIKCRLPEDARAALEMAEEELKKQATDVESYMQAQLKQIPVYQQFLSKVYGCGPVVAAYLCAEVDMRDRPDGKALKPSSVRKYCGFAVINGRLERRTRGVKGGYNANLRMRLFQMVSAMFKNAAKYTCCPEHAATRPSAKVKAEERKAFRDAIAGCAACRATAAPRGMTTKYLDVWANAKHRILSSERVVDGKIRTGADVLVSAKGHAHSLGWHKAVDVFLEDFYIVGRALEGLPVWPSYYAAKLGYEHGGRICVNAPKMLALEEALAVVGDVGARPARYDMDLSDESVERSLEEEMDLAAEE